jgi:predicted nuclease with TOPRIM domain
MIDPKDNSNQPLDLGEVKRRRGRPSTGKAMTNAERQRAYRERAKAQRNEKDDAALISALNRCDELASKLGRANDRIKDLEGEVQRLKAELTSRNEKANPLNAAAELIQYHAQSWDTRSRKWKTIGETNPDNEPFDNWRDAEKFVKDLLKAGSTLRYRIVPANLPVTEYK